MATPAEQFLKLERRVLALEMQSGVTPDRADLIHPKALTQAVSVREKIDAINLLKDELHTFIFSHYDLGTQISLAAAVAAVLAIILNPETPESDRAVAQAQLVRLIMLILPAWQWVQGILSHFYDVIDQIEANGGVYVDPNFSQFAPSDPGASLRLLVKGE
ncbi:MAG: hypothetical protein WC356_01730 [Candidatus Micrarchaeia archaeon]|jgi:hypothetical protein